MSPSALAERFRRTCRDRATAPAVHNLADGTRLSFADLLERFEAIRGVLARLGVGDGSCVASRVGNHPIFVSLFAAVIDLGGALLPIGEAADGEVAALVGSAGAEVVVTDRPLPIATEREVTLEPPIRVLKVPARVAQPYTPSVVLKLTSGSTDLPKAAIAPESALINDTSHIVEAMGITPNDVLLTYIPLSHAYAISHVVTPLVLQGTQVAVRHTFNPLQFVQDVTVSRATVFPGVPFMFDHLRDLPQLDRLPTTLRLLITAGARINPETVTWFHARLDRKIHSFYGASETGGITYDESEELSEPLHVGRPLPGMHVEVRDANPDDGSGRIFVRGNAVAAGYARQAPGGDSPFRDGGFLTGDLGYFDGAGRLVLTGRASTFVNVAGLKVDPAEVERTLMGLPGITNARVLGVADERRGQQLVAFVVRQNPDLTPVAIRQLCAATLSPYKIPRQFLFLDRLPVDARGKTDRHALEVLVTGESDT